MYIRILGPIEAVHDGRVVRLGGRGQRTVLAALALEHGRVVAVDRLVDILWHATPPPSARTKVQAHVSALRKAMGQRPRDDSGPLLTASSGYALSSESVETDLASFDTLISTARAASEAGEYATASDRFATALALWYGPTLAGVVAPTIRAAAGSIEERRLLAVEAKAEADLAIGRCDAIVAELSDWLVVRPLRERLRALLMVGLYRLGCRTEALNLYLDGRQIMISELGLEPSPPLRDLHQRILAGDNGLRAPGRIPPFTAPSGGGAP